MVVSACGRQPCPRRRPHHCICRLGISIRQTSDVPEAIAARSPRVVVDAHYHLYQRRKFLLRAHVLAYTSFQRVWPRPRRSRNPRYSCRLLHPGRSCYRAGLAECAEGPQPHVDDCLDMYNDCWNWRIGRCQRQQPVDTLGSPDPRCPDDLIATVAALTLAIRVIGGSVGYAVYYNVFVNKFTTNSVFYIGGQFFIPLLLIPSGVPY